MPKVKDLPFGKIVWYKDLVVGVKGATLDEKYYKCETYSIGGNPYDYELIPYNYEMIEELEKVLGIIKEKNVDIKLLKNSTSWLDYYTRVKHKTGDNTELTEEDFELLKRWLG